MSYQWRNKTILITGAGSGIGQALARLFGSQGAKLILTDLDADNLATTSNELSENVSIAKVADVSSKQDWLALEQQIRKEIGHLDVLINNAGMSSFGFFDETSEALFDKVMDVNLNGVIMGCRTMQSLLEASERGMIVNVSSIFGLITMPMLTPYHASKFAVRGFTEALRQDFEFQGKNIDVICVMPGGIKTNIANFAETDHSEKAEFAAHFDKVARTSAKQAAKTIEKGMRKKTFRVLIGPDAKIVDILYKALPTHYDKVFNLLLGVEKVIPKLKPHKAKTKTV